jgi:hypothetical protein
VGWRHPSRLGHPGRESRHFFRYFLLNTFLWKSIVVPLLPAFLLRRIFPPTAAETSPYHAPMPRRPSLLLVQPVTTATIRRRPHVSDDPLWSPHVTFSDDNQPRLSSSSLIATPSSYSNSLPTDSGPHNDQRLRSLPCSPSSSLTKMPLPPHSPSPYIHPIALPSLESLDLAADADSFEDKPTSASPHNKRPFRVQMPKLGFGRRHSIDFKSPQNVRASDVAAPTIPAGDSTVDSQGKRSYDDVWHGTRAFAVRRSSTIATAASPAQRAEKTTSPTLTPPKCKLRLPVVHLFAYPPASAP